MLRLARFLKDQSGNVAMLFGFAAVPILGMAGAMMDYSRASQARASLDAAIDSASLMAARDAAKLTDAELRTRVDGWIRANLSGDAAANFTGATVAINRTARTINITAASSVPATLTRVIGQSTLAVKSNSQSTWGTNKIELALVLDNTGSMASSGKMTALKAASLDLIDIMKKATAEADQIKISIVPFNTQVRLDANSYKNESWLRYDMTRDVNCDWRGRNCTTETINKAMWSAAGEGCITDRDKPYDTRDDAAVGAATTYPADFCSQSSLAKVMPLSNDWDALNARINEMTPAGNTNVTIGAVWGMAALSTGAPFTEAQPATTPRLKKFMILLTDGDNTQNRFSTTGSAIDARTSLACKTINDAGVLLYTIRVMDGNADLLRKCATDPSMYYDVQNASQLTPIFKKIAGEISAVRLSM